MVAQMQKALPKQGWTVFFPHAKYVLNELLYLSLKISLADWISLCNCSSCSLKKAYSIIDVRHNSILSVHKEISITQGFREHIKMERV